MPFRGGKGTPDQAQVGQSLPLTQSELAATPHELKEGTFFICFCISAIESFRAAISSVSVFIVASRKASIGGQMRIFSCIQRFSFFKYCCSCHIRLRMPLEHER